MTSNKTPPQTFPAKLLANKIRIEPTDDSNEIRELVIEIDHADFQCAAGQSIGVLAPLPQDSDEPFHLRWYSIADIPGKDHHGRPNVTICVRRVVTKHPITGETVRGLASNYLCDLKPGSSLNVAGPKGIAFPIPTDPTATLILIGAGTGIAPFRVFIKTLHRKYPEWKGAIRLFYGSRTGLDTLYRNDPSEDLQQYFDEETFKAFSALSPEPNWADPIAWDLAFSERGNEILSLIEKPNTYIYVAGREEVRKNLDTLFSKLLGSENRWNLMRQDLEKQNRWGELVYG